MTFGRASILIGQLSDSTLRIGLSAAVGTILFGALGYGVDAAMTSLKLADYLHAGIVGAIVGVGAGFGLWLLLAGLRQRRMHLADELRKINELNHIVRNSLHVIALAQHAENEGHRTIVLESTARIEETLRQLFPVVGPHTKQRENF